MLLKTFVRGLLIILSMKGAVFIAHNSNNYDAHFIFSYLITNGEYPEILAKGGKLLEIKIKLANENLLIVVVSLQCR